MIEEHVGTTDKKYKFKDLKVYASTEWLSDNRKKYRQVFDRYQTAFVYAELSLYNKLFDQADWDVRVQLKCFSLKRGKREVCNLSMEKRISKLEPVAFIREGWGNNPEGSFWKKGGYCWEAYIDDEKVYTRYFYIEDAGSPLTGDNNPYLQIHDIKLYEGPYDDVPDDKRTYHKVFNENETRYIFLDMAIQNTLYGKPWQCELIVKFYNEARELKGQISKLRRIEKDEDILAVSIGWGSHMKGIWRQDRYTAEVIFMDRLLAVVPFSIGTYFEEGFPDVNYRTDIFQLPKPAIVPTEATSLDDIMLKMDELVGLDAVKRSIRDHALYIQFLQLRKQKGFAETEPINLHSVFIGNPGTGKTTVAEMLGSIYKRMGLLSKGHVHSVDRSDIVGEYIGQTAPKVKEAIDKARGGILFLDEAYALARSNDDTKDFGREVVEILIKEMSNGQGDIAIIAAGYPKEMGHLLESNPGLKSRFAQRFEFADYLPQQLHQIAQKIAKDKEVAFSPEAWDRIKGLVTEAFRSRDKSFGNARFVQQLVEKAKLNLGLRVMQSPDPGNMSLEAIKTIQLEDVTPITLSPETKTPIHQPHVADKLVIQVDEEALAAALQELDNLIGLKELKVQIRELVKLVRYYTATSADTLQQFYLHTVMVGNPGTGKTTVARIVAAIYKALGVLERGHLVETDRQGLVSGILGQTAHKTAEKVEEAMGGVLFIDEAYSLTMRPGGLSSDYGDEAIQTLLKRMEDKRGKFYVFVAGYPENMEHFLKTNPGLSSRFDKVLRFPDYSPDELYQIAITMLAAKKMNPDPDAAQQLQQYISYSFERRDKHFGNARFVRTLTESIIQKQHLRLASMLDDERTNAAMETITTADIQDLNLEASDKPLYEKTKIGFGRSGS